MNTTLAVQQSPTTQSIQTQPQDKCPVGSHKDREARGRALAETFVNGLGRVVVQFIREREAEIKEVRQDFVIKPKDELICGVATWEAYCDAILGYSKRHMNRILEGQNPSLSDAKNADARQRIAKRELDAKVKRNQNALPKHKKSNEEILEEDRTEAIAANDVVKLQKQVVALTTQLQAVPMQPPYLPESQRQDFKKIHAIEVERLEAEIKTLQASVAKLTKAYETLRRDAIALATLGIAIRKSTKMHDRSELFLQKHGETVGGAL